MCIQYLHPALGTLHACPFLTCPQECSKMSCAKIPFMYCTAHPFWTLTNLLRPQITKSVPSQSLHNSAALLAKPVPEKTPERTRNQ